MHLALIMRILTIHTHFSFSLFPSLPLLVSRNEASQLLFQPGYIQVLKQMAMSGQMQMYNIRSVAWRVSPMLYVCTYIAWGGEGGR